jgi:hypothetical protein
MKVVKVKSWKELVLQRLGTTWLRRPNPTEDCKSNGRRRRRRRRILYIYIYIYMSKNTLVRCEISIPFKKTEDYNMAFLYIF